MNRPPGSSSSTGSNPRPGIAGLPAGIQGLLQEGAAAISARVNLLALELRRARDVLPKIIALLVLAAVVALTGWFALWVAIALLLVQVAEWSPVWTMALVTVVNVVVAGVLAWRAVALVPLLALPATLHHLTVKNANNPSEVSS
ncbi:phage holin family protein [uncultured Aquincola sp.]|uniref:phage holin family protein n=1 Tax=uncultured Aquincola sp. TaxID=886556 RepID=UPI0032B29DD5|tara:strand:+ start:258 stop:689 length:432 start_codon:yes stop_codon:yes gene_type:complete